MKLFPPCAGDYCTGAQRGAAVARPPDATEGEHVLPRHGHASGARRKDTAGDSTETPEKVQGTAERPPRTTSAVVTTCSASTDCTDSAMSCGGGSFTPDGAYNSLWDSVKPMKGKYTINCFQYQEDVGCVCVLNDWISSNDEICADNYNYFRFKLKGNGRSEFWEVYLYGDQTIKVDRDSAEVLPRECHRLALMVSTSVLHPTWQWITSSMSCASLLSVTRLSQTN